MLIAFILKFRILLLTYFNKTLKKNYLNYFYLKIIYLLKHDFQI